MTTDDPMPQDPLATPPDARDVTAELAAAPRRRLPWPTLVLSGAVLATLAFAGGVQYQKSNGTPDGQQRAARTNQQSTGQNGYPGGGNRRAQNGTGGTGNQPGFTRGTVKAVDGSTVYLTDANGNTVKVTTTDATKVQLAKEGKAADLQPGQTVTVVGTPDASGGYAATQLTEGGALGGFGGARPGAAASPTG
ncbi:hypothetical protein F4556_003486 [Kitasatospora gansuensis]|uniref:DUF5666 domain-containing protein n=1 Tax=Kitasatospora gansuensis TaxID=258050 RepID=A0A7W7SEM4_9ACTN|nr:DUF5666 domain-containing protein [Kitasatospora gansuensis]MBB4947951.1 hypothetical protein [Kitasatospora gansuensis]